MNFEPRKLRQLIGAIIVVLALAAPASFAGGLYNPDDGPTDSSQAVKDVVVTEHKGSQIPLDLTFTDETGKNVRLGDYFNGRKPVIIQLGYYGCPMLCGLISRGLIDSVKKVSLTAGKDYELVFVSIDPKETPELAASKKEAYLAEYGRDSSAGWHFLTGRQENIAALAQADGFGYKWIQSAGQFAHPAALTLCMPDGRISRYLYGVRFDPTTLRMSIVEASDGKVGTVLDEAFLTCFRYDGHQGKYAFVAMNLMRGGGLVIMMIVGSVLIRMFRNEAKLRAQSKAQPAGH
jgi:protein SCO1/2